MATNRRDFARFVDDVRPKLVAGTAAQRSVARHECDGTAVILASLGSLRLPRPHGPVANST